MMKTFKSPSQGAATTVWAAVSPHFEKPENCGRYLSDVGEGVAMTKDAEMVRSEMPPLGCTITLWNAC